MLRQGLVVESHVAIELHGERYETHWVVRPVALASEPRCPPHAQAARATTGVEVGTKGGEGDYDNALAKNGKLMSMR